MSHGYTLTHQTGRVGTGETDQVWAPRTPRTGTCGLILCHGATAPNEFIDLISQAASVRLAAALASAGIPCLSGTFGGDTFANDTAMTRIESAWTVLKGLYPAMRTDKVALLGVSMGGAVAARYSQLNPTKVAALVGIIPLWDIVALYAGNVGGLATSVATAWGVTAPAALPPEADIAANAAAAAGIPTLAGYSTADAFIDPAWVTTYATTVGATTTIIDTTSGHTDTTVGKMPIATVGEFLAAHGA